MYFVYSCAKPFKSGSYSADSRLLIPAPAVVISSQTMSAKAESLIDTPDTATVSNRMPDFDDASSELKAALTECSAKQRHFVFHYIQHLDHVRAYRDAGYSKNSAKNNALRLLRTKNVQRAVECALEIKLQRQIIDRDWIEDQYISLYFAARARHELGHARGCLRDLAEHHGMFVKQVAVLRGTDLERRLAAGRERAGITIEQAPEASNGGPSSPVDQADIKRLASADPSIEGDVLEHELAAALAGARPVQTE